MDLTLEEVKSEQVVRVIRSVRNLHQEIDLMFEETDKFMSPLGWHGTKYNLAHSHQYIIGNADCWMPSVLSRTYWCRDFPHLFSFLTVTLDSGEKPEDF